MKNILRQVCVIAISAAVAGCATTSRDNASRDAASSNWLEVEDWSYSDLLKQAEYNSTWSSGSPRASGLSAKVFLKEYYLDETLPIEAAGQYGEVTSPFLAINQSQVSIAIKKITNNDYNAACSGVLISDRWILTAGHCTTPTVAGQPVNDGDFWVKVPVSRDAGDTAPARRDVGDPLDVRSSDIHVDKVIRFSEINTDEELGWQKGSTHGESGNSIANGDFSLLHLETAIPDDSVYDIAALPILDVDQAVSAGFKGLYSSHQYSTGRGSLPPGISVSSYGFGITENGTGQASRWLRRVTNRLVSSKDSCIDVDHVIRTSRQFFGSPFRIEDSEELPSTLENALDGSIEDLDWELYGVSKLKSVDLTEPTVGEFVPISPDKFTSLLQADLGSNIWELTLTSESGDFWVAQGDRTIDGLLHDRIAAHFEGVQTFAADEMPARRTLFRGTNNFHDAFCLSATQKVSNNFGDFFGLSCQGDSGGPVILEGNVTGDIVLGLNSWGPDGRCGTFTGKEFDGIQDITPYTKDIIKVIANYESDNRTSAQLKLGIFSDTAVGTDNLARVDLSKFGLVSGFYVGSQPTVLLPFITQ